MGKNYVTQGTAVAGRFQAIETEIPYYEKVAFSLAASTESLTTYDLPSQALLVDIFANITTVGSTAGTMDVGTYSSSSGGDADGFMNDLDIGTSGIGRPALTASSSGAPGWFMAANTYGAKLSDFQVGTTVTNVFGIGSRKNYATDSVTAKSISITPSTTDAIVGVLFLGLVDLLSSE